MKINIPDAFDDICGLFYQGISFYIPTIEGQIDWVLEGQSRENLEISKNFLDELLSRKFDKDQLTDIWNSTKTSVTFFDGTDKNAADPGIVYFLKLLRSSIEQKLREAGGAEGS
jgi:hypothetical protein